MPLVTVDHPLAAHLLAELRDRNTPPTEFRYLAHQLTIILALEATRELATRDITVETPLEPTAARALAMPIAVVPILRAGLGMLEPFTTLFPDVAVGYIGLERNEETAAAREYYVKVPDLRGKVSFCVDPMLATGGSAAHAVTVMKTKGAENIRMVCVVAAPEGVTALLAAHPDVTIFTAALDRGLNERKYILPGLGDFGDRLFATP
ncbi:MAG: uracil phosphoribosyltransferase [Fimbriimonadaceae bacterium]|nr:uracil phosphoribosyltransferase [Fimbriimonadaceae bacterium]